MFSLIDIAEMHDNHKYKSLLDRCEVSTCKTEHIFVKRHGAIPAEQCDFPEAYNGIISSKGEGIKTYIIGATLWAFDEGHFHSTTLGINVMLMMYVFSKHCGGRYEEITTVGYWDKDNFNIILLPVSDIQDVILNSIAYNYIGYKKGNGSWETAEGTNNSILYEAVEYFKHSRKYRNALSNFKYEDAQRRRVAGFEIETNYPIVRETNCFLSAPVKFGGSDYENINVNYISDIHIEEHIDTTESILPQIRKVARQLSNSRKSGLVFFGGDTADDRMLCALFYREYMLREQFVYYKKWKDENNYKPALSLQDAETEYERRLNILHQQKDEHIRRLKPWLKYTRRLEKKDEYEMDRYISSTCFTREQYPGFVGIRLKKIKRIEKEIQYLEANKDKHLEALQQEHKYQKVKIDDVFAVLGNHEMTDFDTVDGAVSFYSKLFINLGIHFLNNSIMFSNRIVILGGCGFAKYNPVFNATCTPNAKTFTRENEIRETDYFEETYHKALDKAKAERKPLIVLAHYPTKDWLENDQCDSQAVYFTGHTHQNASECTEQRHVYADNQIGNNRKSILFKTARLGTVPNPFIDFEDGCYEITTDQYRDYYRYSGDPISGTFGINNMLLNGGKFFMIKHCEFYGFFIQSETKEILICYGGSKKKIPRVKSIDYLMKNFDAMVSIYLKAMLPFREVQEQLSSELKTLGLSGKIHGCIVDVDFYHHIMLNPLDGSITYYYSPRYGTVQMYITFAELLEHICSNYIIGEQDVRERYGLMATSGCILSKESFLTSDEVGKMVTIDIKNSIYGLSARINQLQRLFTSRVLRDWNPAQIEKINRERNLIEDGSVGLSDSIIMDASHPIVD